MNQLITFFSENKIFFNNFYEVIPYLKFPHYTVNQAILEAFQGYDTVHAIEYNLMRGLLCLKLITTFTLSWEDRINGISPPSTDRHNYIMEINLKFLEFR